LYKDSSHFLLELIQNADDNRYSDDVKPQATFFYRRDGLLFFGCNELGFDQANLAALCSANRSTKKLHKGKKGSIGEKGIGFKSVFKVANEVSIVFRNNSASC
jgi:HSP90 family molecular chaperone